MTVNPDDSDQNGYVEKNYEFIRPVPAFILGAIIMVVAAHNMLDRKSAMMKSEYRGEITAGVYVYLTLALFYSIYFFLREARLRCKNSRLPLFQYFWVLLVVAILSLQLVTSNLYFYTGRYETAKSLAGAVGFGVPAAMLPLLLGRLAARILHKPSKK